MILNETMLLGDDGKYYRYRFDKGEFDAITAGDRVEFEADGTNAGQISAIKQKGKKPKPKPKMPQPEEKESKKSKFSFKFWNKKDEPVEPDYDFKIEPIVKKKVANVEPESAAVGSIPDSSATAIETVVSEPNLKDDGLVKNGLNLDDVKTTDLTDETMQSHNNDNINFANLYTSDANAPDFIPNGNDFKSKAEADFDGFTSAYEADDVSVKFNMPDEAKFNEPASIKSDIKFSSTPSLDEPEVRFGTAKFEEPSVEINLDEPNVKFNSVEIDDPIAKPDLPDDTEIKFDNASVKFDMPEEVKFNEPSFVTQTQIKTDIPEVSIPKLDENGLYAVKFDTDDDFVNESNESQLDTSDFNESKVIEPEVKFSGPVAELSELSESELKSEALSEFKFNAPKLDEPKPNVKFDQPEPIVADLQKPKSTTIFKDDQSLEVQMASGFKFRIDEEPTSTDTHSNTINDTKVEPSQNNANENIEPKSEGIIGAAAGATMNTAPEFTQSNRANKPENITQTAQKPTETQLNLNQNEQSKYTTELNLNQSEQTQNQTKGFTAELKSVEKTRLQDAVTPPQKSQNHKLLMRAKMLGMLSGMLPLVVATLVFVLDNIVNEDRTLLINSAAVIVALLSYMALRSVSQIADSQTLHVKFIKSIIMAAIGVGLGIASEQYLPKPLSMEMDIALMVGFALIFIGVCWFQIETFMQLAQMTKNNLFIAYITLFIVGILMVYFKFYDKIGLGLMGAAIILYIVAWIWTEFVVTDRRQIVDED